MNDCPEVALVTGAGSGIGQATAEMLAAAGYRVLCADILGAEVTSESLSRRGFAAEAYRLDVSCAEDWSAVVNAVADKKWIISALINVAGVVEPGTAVDQTFSAWDTIINTNLKGVWLGLRAVLPQMISRGRGRVVNIASLAAVVGLPDLSAYSAAKAGVIGLSRQAAVQYASMGININVVCPGLIETPILGDITESMRSDFNEAIPIRRLGRPEEIASTVVHLVGSGGDYITGQTFVIDGGWSAK